MQKSEFSQKFRMQRYTFILLIGSTSEYPSKMDVLSLYHKHDGSITRVYQQGLTRSLPEFGVRDTRTLKSHIEPLLTQLPAVIMWHVQYTKR